MDGNEREHIVVYLGLCTRFGNHWSQHVSFNTIKAEGLPLGLQLSLSTLINEEIQAGLRVTAYICHVRLGFSGVRIGNAQWHYTNFQQIQDTNWLSPFSHDTNKCTFYFQKYGLSYMFWRHLCYLQGNPLIFNLGLTLRPLNPCGKIAGSSWIWGWVGSSLNVSLRAYNLPFTAMFNVYDSGHAHSNRGFRATCSRRHSVMLPAKTCGIRKRL